MHALMAAVMLGMAGLDALDADAEPQPPDRELGEVEQAVGTGEGDGCRNGLQYSSCPSCYGG